MSTSMLLTRMQAHHHVSLPVCTQPCSGCMKPRKFGTECCELRRRISASAHSRQRNALRLSSRAERTSCAGGPQGTRSAVENTVRRTSSRRSTLNWSRGAKGRRRAEGRKMYLRGHAAATPGILKEHEFEDNTLPKGQESKRFRRAIASLDRVAQDRFHLNVVPLSINSFLQTAHGESCVSRMQNQSFSTLRRGSSDSLTMQQNVEIVSWSRFVR